MNNLTQKQIDNLNQLKNGNELDIVDLLTLVDLIKNFQKELSTKLESTYLEIEKKNIKFYN
jgi:hypothetical protein